MKRLVQYRQSIVASDGTSWPLQEGAKYSNTSCQQYLAGIDGMIGEQWQTTTVPKRDVAMRHHAHAWVGRLLLGGLVTLALGAATVANANGAIIQVNCNAGQSLKKAVRQAAPGDTIRVTGTCTERVTITTDRLTLAGGGSAVLDGGGGDSITFAGGVTIDGARGVTIDGFTIQHSPGWGILGTGSAAFAVKNTTMQDNAWGGLFLDSASAEVTDAVVQRSGIIGIFVQNNSTAVFRGNVSSTDSVTNGIAVQSGSTLEIRGASVHASHNGGSGVDIVDSQVVIFGYPESEGSRLVANHNQVDGISVAMGSLSIFGGGGFAGNFTISTSHNGGSGILLIVDGTMVSPGAAARIISKHNAVGVFLGEGGRAFLVGGLTVQSNQTGLLGDAAGTITLISDPSNPSSITNNDQDVDLKFGTRATFDGVTIGTIACDATVLSRGSTVCP